jgi:hypothetical protein
MTHAEADELMIRASGGLAHAVLLKPQRPNRFAVRIWSKRPGWNQPGCFGNDFIEFGAKSWPQALKQVLSSGIQLAHPEVLADAL